MIYLDTSALVKKYVREPHSDRVRKLLSRDSLIATSTISRATAVAAFARAVRIQSLTSHMAEACLRNLRREWKNYIRIQVTEGVVARADGLAWESKLRGYDAVHLASALELQDRLGEAVVLATFDHQLWNAALETGLERFPDSLE